MNKNRLKIKDLFFVALYGVRARKGRATLTSIGIGIGIAAIVAVSGFQHREGQIFYQLWNP